jgi:hypothetical protein
MRFTGLVPALITAADVDAEVGRASITGPMIKETPKSIRN